MVQEYKAMVCSKQTTVLAVAAGIAAGAGFLAGFFGTRTEARAGAELSAPAAEFAAGFAAGSGQPGAEAEGKASGGTDQRIRVKTIDDLPRRTYTIAGGAVDLLKDEARFMPLLDRLITDVLGDLETYLIEDSTTLRGYYDLLATAYSLKGNLTKALEYSDRAAALETKDQDKAMRGVVLRARIKAKDAAGGSEEGARFESAFKEELRRVVSALPYELVKDRLISVRNSANIVSRGLIESSVATTIDPILDANKGEAPAALVASLVSTKATLDFGLKALPLMAEVYDGIIAEMNGATTTADLWSPRLIELEATAKAKPVVIGVWDSGVDTSLYTGQLWTNPFEKANGRDDDNNGFVDDLHGIAFGRDHRPTTGALSSLAELSGDKDQLIGFIAAAQDMQAGLINERVLAFQEHYSKLRGEELRTFSDDLSLLGGYVHGTHVAGVALAGNPFARLVHITENWPHKSIPDTAPTVEEGKAWGESAKQAVEYLRAADARVVNMSWRVGRAAFEGMLQAKGVGATPEERAELSRQIFAGLRDGLEEAIRSAPDILFIAGSGNEDNDVDFAEYIPAGLRLPNLITVGAVDAQNRFTTFTTTGENVTLYANGYRIESNIPGGQRIEFSGTSMAAPQVANLAAKILALRPGLKPAEVVELIRANADPIPGEPGRYVINPKRTIESIGG